MRKYELIMIRTQRTLLKYRPTTAYTNKNPIRYTYTGIVVGIRETAGLKLHSIITTV